MWMQLPLSKPDQCQKQRNYQLLLAHMRLHWVSEAYLFQQVCTDGANNVLPGAATRHKGCLGLQGQQALQDQPAVLYLVGNVSVGVLPKGLCPVHRWQSGNVVLHNVGCMHSLFG